MEGGDSCGKSGSAPPAENVHPQRKSTYTNFKSIKFADFSWGNRESKVLIFGFLYKIEENPILILYVCYNLVDGGEISFHLLENKKLRFKGDYSEEKDHFSLYNGVVNSHCSNT